jgi:hypothetical protein
MLVPALGREKITLGLDFFSLLMVISLSEDEI